MPSAEPTPADALLDALDEADAALRALCALGVDGTGAKHVLGLWEGATENEVACKAMLANLVERGLDPKRPRLMIIDGSKALRKAIRCAFGRRALVQRCQVHKMRNVEGHLPDERQAAVRAAMREAYTGRRPASHRHDVTTFRPLPHVVIAETLHEATVA